MLPVDNRRVETLGDYVRRVRTEKGLSTTDVETISRQGSLKGISDAYVTQIENGHVTNVSPQKLAALARGLQISEEELFAVVRGKVPPVRSVEIAPEDLEDRAKRRELMALLFDDIPDDCQLDTLASMVGVHARRGISLRIHERSGARADALSKISQLISELLPTNTQPLIDRKENEQRKEVASAQQSQPDISRVASSLYPEGWETQPPPGRENEAPIFSPNRQKKVS